MKQPFGLVKSIFVVDEKFSVRSTTGFIKGTLVDLRIPILLLVGHKL